MILINSYFYVPAGDPGVRTVTIDHTKCGNENCTNIPILFQGTYSYLKSSSAGGYVNNAHGYDIVFYSDYAKTTKLDFEMLNWEPTTGNISAFVKMPLVSSSAGSDTSFFLGYNDNSITTDQSNTSGVWSNNYVGVWHMVKSGSIYLDDSTGTGHTLTNNNAVVTGSDGKVHLGAAFNISSASYFSVANSGDFALSEYSIEIWINWSALASDADFAIWYGQNSTSNTYGILVGNGSPYSVGGETGPYYNSYYAQNGGTSANTWYHLTSNYSSSLEEFFVDASSVGTDTTGFYSPSAANLLIGRHDMGFFSYNWEGLLNEVRIGSVVRSPSWVTIQRNNQNDPSTFYSVS